MFALIRNIWVESFRIPKPTLTEKNLPDQSGKVFIITGSNTGVGYEVAKILYGRNGKVYVAARSESKALAAIDSIKKSHPSSKGSLHFLYLNLSDLTTIKDSANEFLSKEDKLHWLDNNAGVMVPPVGSKGAQGLDLQYQTNILGPFLFSKLLQPILKKTAETEPKGTVRVSWAGSLTIVASAPPNGVTWTTGKDGLPTLDDTLPNPTVYGASKCANYFLAHEFARRFAADGVLHNSYNPGNLASDLQRHVPSIVGRIVAFLSYHPIFGAYTELYSGLSRDITIEKDQAGYIVPWGRKSNVRADQIAEVEKGVDGNASKLYEWADRITKEYQ